MLSHSAVIEVVADRLRAHPVPFLVVDPVMVAASGDVLLKPEAIASLRDLMIPLATIVTPNIYEAEILTGIKVTGVDAMRDAARALVANGARAALVKGGRLDAGDAIDVYYNGQILREFRSPRIRIERAHGTGCTLSAALAASLALGVSLEDAVDRAKRYVTRALETAPKLGHGATLLNHLVKPDISGS